MRGAGGMVEIFLFILVAGLLANFIGASVHEGIFVGALVSLGSPICRWKTAACINLWLAAI